MITITALIIIITLIGTILHFVCDSSQLDSDFWTINKIEKKIILTFKYFESTKNMVDYETSRDSIIRIDGDVFYIILLKSRVDRLKYRKWYDNRAKQLKKEKELKDTFDFLNSCKQNISNVKKSNEQWKEHKLQDIKEKLK